MSLTKEALLIPRYKVIALWPRCEYSIGDVIVLTKYMGINACISTEGQFIEWESFFKEYPHLFKPLEWWEERAIEDMPEYIVFTKDYMAFKQGSVYKHHHWMHDNSTPFCIGFETGPGEYEKYAVPPCAQLMPATEQEYKNYINQKQ